LALLFTALLVPLLVVVGGNPAYASVTPHSIHPWIKTSKCLDEATENHFVVQNWTCSGAGEQKWYETFHTELGGYFTFQNARFTAYCLTSFTNDVGSVSMFECQGTQSQQWTVFAANNPVGGPGWYQIWQNVGNDLCMYFTDVNTNGSGIAMTTCSADLTSAWFYTN
jgi:hypothetical protein